MWDVLGKSLGAPVYQLLGGAVRDKVRTYCHIAGTSADEYVAAAQAKRSQGFSAFKMGFAAPVRILEPKSFFEHCKTIFGSLRDALGNEVDIAVDFHGRFSPAMAKQLIKVLEPYHPFFIEEPCLPENVDVLADIARSTIVPIATSERLFTKWAFREVLEKKAAAIVQPDLCHAGGILEGKKISTMAECYYAGIAPHNPLGPISLAAALQLDACTPNFLIQEQVTLGEGYIKQPFTVKDGYIDIPTAPGLGIELDDEKVAELVYEGNWVTPRVWDKFDGSVADW